MELLFVYGTLGDVDVQRRIIGREVPGVPDALDGYYRTLIEMSDGTFPIIVAGPGSVTGRLLRLSHHELARTDAYETEAYRRIRVRLRSGIEAWVYAR